MAALLTSTAVAAATAPALVADLRQSGGGAGSAPEAFDQSHASATIGATTYFVARTAESGSELWRSDGTPAGTGLVVDLNPGRDDSDPISLTVFNGYLYFYASDGVHGSQLWRSDGTAQGTQLLYGEHSGFYKYQQFFEISATADALYFVAVDPNVGPELWRSDGTGAAPVLLGDIRPGTYYSPPSSLTPVGALLYFAADDGISGQELWVTDGTPAGTHRVHDIAPGGAGARIGGFTRELRAIGDRLYFSATDDTHGAELWVTDGTESGTKLVRDINPTTSTSGPQSLSDLGGTLLFFENDASSGMELWRTDGTEANTVRVRDICPGSCSGSDVGGRFVAVVGGRLYFPASDQGTNLELWSSDGTATGTQLVRDVNPGSHSSVPMELLASSGKLYFSADDGTHGREPWVSDGTANGTVLLADIDAGPAGSLLSIAFNPTRRNFLASPNGVIFTADDGIVGNEPWHSDGTTAGTALLRDIEPRAGSFPNALKATPNRAYFIAGDEDTTTQVWRTDGTADSTLRLSDLSADDVPAGASEMTTDSEGNLFFISANEAPTLQLWHSDGTRTGTTLAREWYHPGWFAYPDEGQRLESLGTTAYFFSYDETHGSELWHSDGTPAGTSMLIDLYPGIGWSEPVVFPFGFATIGGYVVGGAGEPQFGVEPRATDGTAQGTTLLADIDPGTDVAVGSEPGEFRRAGDWLYFTAVDGVNCRLYRTDGTPQHTSRFIDPAADIAFCADYAVLGDRVIFMQQPDETGAEPWTSDGTVAGTGPLMDITPGDVGSRPHQFVSVGAFVYFIATDSQHGRELWRTDGTSAGTLLVRDVRPGAESSAPYGVTAIGNTIVFGANDGTTGYELWMSNGSKRGTVRIGDIRPGSGSALPENFASFGSSLLFAADDGTHGVELWRLATRDADGDQVLDRVDTCIRAPNASQLDSDGDGYGNRCDADIARPNDCMVDQRDFAVMQAALHSTPQDPNWNPDADLNGDLVVSSRDVAILRDSLHSRPGPSGLTRACTRP